MKPQEVAFDIAQTKFTNWLVSEVERLAKVVIDTHPQAISFCMAMGSASFYCEWEECDDHDPTDVWQRSEHINPGDIVENSYAAELDDLLSKWDNQLCITGVPMRITRDNVTGKLIVDTDW